MRVDWKDIGLLAVESAVLVTKGIVQLGLFTLVVPFCLVIEVVNLALWGGGSRNP